MKMDTDNRGGAPWFCFGRASMEGGWGCYRNATMKEISDAAGPWDTVGSWIVDYPQFTKSLFAMQRVLTTRIIYSIFIAGNTYV